MIAAISLAQPITLLVAIALGFIATGISWRLLLYRGPQDLPEARRLHQLPTPRGGAIGIALLVWLCAAVALFSGALLLAPLLLMSACAALGALDDFKPQSAAVRLVVQIAIAAIAANSWLPAHPMWLQLIAAIAVVTLVNFANFLDGSNGYLAGLFVLFAIFALALKLPESALIALLAALFIGFLPFNFPHARVFMGDVGSYLIGAALACVLLATLQHSVTASGEVRNVHALLQLALLLMPICMDPLMTILKRTLQRRAIWRAHREHVFQWLRRSDISAPALLFASATEALVLALIAATSPTSLLAWLVPLWFIASALAWIWLKRLLLKQKRSAAQLR
jgi:UDP-N-acetylmuramyl pentapeptide phosphotransferase/UDP-N-acetylglucosamine-1-phosphate transferase